MCGTTGRGTTGRGWNRPAELKVVAVQGYASSAQTPYALDNMRWIGDYIMKLHYSDVEFCAQARP